jgi:hypothetical protein
MSIDLDSTWFQQPCCCCCGGSDDRPDDPCEAYSADRFGPDWMHRSCMAKFVAWEREQIVEQNEAEARARAIRT